MSTLVSCLSTKPRSLLSSLPSSVGSVTVACQIRFFLIHTWRIGRVEYSTLVIAKPGPIMAAWHVVWNEESRCDARREATWNNLEPGHMVRLGLSFSSAGVMSH
jgi:hypothetical protein